MRILDWPARTKWPTKSCFSCAQIHHTFVLSYTMRGTERSLVQPCPGWKSHCHRCSSFSNVPLLPQPTGINKRMRGQSACTHTPPRIGWYQRPREPATWLSKHGKCPKYQIHFCIKRIVLTQRKENKHWRLRMEAGHHPIKYGVKITGWRSEPTREQGGTFEWVLSPIGISR